MSEQDRDLSQMSMRDLFRMEVETQVQVLTENLLKLEELDENREALAAIARAAHSIKGAARIVQVDPAVRIAHVLEDCLVAVQKGQIALDSAAIDRLLAGGDLLLAMSQVDENEFDRWLADRQGEIERQEAQIAAILNESEAAIAPPESTPGGAIDAETVETKPTNDSATATGERVVRLSADNLNRLMGLAGESLIESNWLQPFANSLLQLKTRQLELCQLLEQLETSCDRDRHGGINREALVSAREQAHQCSDTLNDRLEELDRFSGRFSSLCDRLYREAIAAQMRPFREGTANFPRAVRDLAKDLGKQVKLDIIGQSTPIDRDILDKLQAPLTQLLRNAIDHGIEPPEERLAKGKTPEGRIRLEATHRAGMLSILVSDDGRGLDFEQLRRSIVEKELVTPEMSRQLSENELIEFLFLPGFSSAREVTEISGRGVGLDVAKTMVQQVSGSLKAFANPDGGLSFQFQLPLTLSVIRTLLVEIAGEPYAFPLTRINCILRIAPSEISWVENRQYIHLNGQNISLIGADRVLELDSNRAIAPHANRQELDVISIGTGSHTYGLVVDRAIGERDIVVKPLDPRLGKIRDISAAALMEDGSPLLIVDVEDLLRSIETLLASGVLASGEFNSFNREPSTIAESVCKHILVVDDSITVREMERKLLENRGYRVDVAVNGVDAWNALISEAYDLVITDVDMPRMNGIELVSQMKSHPQIQSIPVIIVSYKEREEDRLLGLEVGANYYLTKSSFHDNTFVNAVIDTIGGSGEERF
jgi:two-component system sensor histidine kinase and response regulator WspE